MEKERLSSSADYPRTIEELELRFSTEEACRSYLWNLRWPDGFQCPRCEGTRVWPTGRSNLFECGTCHYQISITSGTVFEGSRKPLVQWFRAIWWMTNEKNGASALGLQRVLGLGSYQTAWAWLHKLRRAMVRPGRELLKGRVEVDETYLGGPRSGKRGRGAEDKALIAIAAEENGTGIGRIRMARIPDVSGQSLEGFIRANVMPGTIVHSDAWRGYNGLSELGYVHEVTNVSCSDVPAHVTMPRVHRVASLLKRWILGTHQGGISHDHLEYYLDEFTFRFNRRTSRNRGKLFYRLLQQAVDTDAIPYSSLVGGSNHAKPQDVVDT
jgi:transposase-like protein